MTIAELIALATVRSGKHKTELAKEMRHTDSTRLSKIATGRLRAHASEVIYLAQAANLPPIKVLAEIESQRDPELAFVWEKTDPTLKARLTYLYLSLGRLFQRPRISAR